MAIKRINESPSITDQIIFDILTPDVDGCFLSDPYKVEKITIFYIERSFTADKHGEYERKVYDSNLLNELEKAKKTACLSPTDDNLLKVSRLEDELLITAKKNTFYFTNATPVAVFGTPDNPAWISSDTENALITLISEDEEGSTQYGHFTLEWTPVGLREGDYFICWNWYPNPAGDSLSNSLHFNLSGNTHITTSIPTHFTNESKYITLLNRYLPEHVKLKLTDSDLTPLVIEELHHSVAKFFNFIEDLVNQSGDLLDANATHESILPFLGSFFGLKLRSNDPTLWRRQIKRAIPLFKKKGTLSGVSEALAQAGMKLIKFTKMWQVISPYTWQEVFIYETENVFQLEKTPILPIQSDNFELWYRASDSDEWQQLNQDYVVLESDSTMTWVGDQLSINPITLLDGDTIRVIYQYSSGVEQDIEDYIRLLPLMDQRDERNQSYPLKNWNVRLIDEDDPLFDIIVTSRHPYKNPVIFGKIRTEFPYSENIYNMEEYNGSKRDTTDPCFIDKIYLEKCNDCQGSNYSIDLEIEDLSNDRILEAQEILDEYMPFHAKLHAINLLGGVYEFISPPLEEIQALIQVKIDEIFVLSGQFVFNRGMEDGLTIKQIKRDMLAESEVIETSLSGVGYNDKIIVYAQDIVFDGVSNNNLFEIFAPHPKQGEYVVSEMNGNLLTISGTSSPMNDPIVENNFTFRLSNEVYSYSSANIVQDDLFKFYSTEINFAELGVKSNQDMANDETYLGGPWKVAITGYPTPFFIDNVLPDGGLILLDPNTDLPTTNTSDLSFNLLMDNYSLVASASDGELHVTRRAKVNTVTDLSHNDLRKFIQKNDYLLLNSVQYQITEFIDAHSFYIINYDDGDASGQSIIVYRRIVDNGIGFLGYTGLTLETSVNYETELPILNGSNALAIIPDGDQLKENYLIRIGTDYYAITEIDGTTITLNGPEKTWTLGGTGVTFDIVKYTKQEITIEDRNYPPMAGHTFDSLDRRGEEIITVDISNSAMVTMLNVSSSSDSSNIIDNVKQKESISYIITYIDNSTETGFVL